MDSLLSSKLRLSILILIISSILIAGGYLYFSYEAKSLREDAHNRLMSVAKLKIGQIDNWNEERITDARAFSRSPFFVNGLEAWLKNKKDNSLKEKLHDRLSLIMNDPIYSDIMIASPEGKLLLSFDPRFNELDSLTKAVTLKTVEKKDVEMSDLFYCSVHKTIHLDYIAPILNNSNEAIAVLVFRVNPYKYLYPLIEEWPTPSRSSETIIIRREGNNALYLNELRRHRDSALKLKDTLTHTGIPAVMAINGSRGIVEGENYAGINVLAYIGQIPGTPWILIAKIDKSEMYQGLYFREGVVVVFTFLIITVLTFALIWYYHYRQRNIFKELYFKEQQLRQSQEEFKTILYSIGDGVITTDTNGNVKKMNAVAEELTGWKESESEDKPVEEVFNIVNEESRKNVENPVHKVLENGTIVGLANHTMLIAKDGSERPIADSGSPIKNSDGNVEGVVLIFRDKTEEHLAEKAIRKSEERLNRAEISSKAGNWEVHLNDMSVLVSEGAALIYGIPKENLTYDVIKIVPLPEYRQLLDEAIRDLITAGKKYNVEFKIKAIDTGEIKDIHSIAEYDKESNVIFGVIRDITESKKLEQERFRMLDIVEKSLNEIYVFDMNTLKFEYLNRGALSNIGYSLDEMKLLTPYEIKPYITEAEFRKTIEPLISGEKEKIVFETVHERKDKSTYPVEVHLQLHKYGKNGLFFAVINDISERKIAENKIKDNEAFLTNLLETIPIPVFYKDKEGRYAGVNNAFVNVFGYSREECIGKTVFDLYPAEMAEKYNKMDLALYETGESQIYETRFADKNGKLHDVVFHKAAYKSDSNKAEGLIAAALDITEQKKNEHILLEQKEEFETIFNLVPAQVWYKDTNNGFIRVNRQVCLDLGMTNEQIEGHTADELFPEFAKQYFEDDSEVFK